ncbi:hypothetical protein CY34DRAFT_810388, partial [Suillus luteus UH-Slu-Lm8-n1]
ARYVYCSHFFVILRTTHASHPIVIAFRKSPWYARQCLQSRCTTTAWAAPAYVGLIHSLTYFPLVTLTRIKEQHSRHGLISALRVSLSGGVVEVVSGSSSYTDSSTLQANTTSSYYNVSISSTGATSASAPHFAG